MSQGFQNKIFISWINWVLSGRQESTNNLGKAFLAFKSIIAIDGDLDVKRSLKPFRVIDTTQEVSEPKRHA